MKWFTFRNFEFPISPGDPQLRAASVCVCSGARCTKKMCVLYRYLVHPKCSIRTVGFNLAPGTIDDHCVDVYCRT